MAKLIFVLFEKMHKLSKAQLKRTKKETKLWQKAAAEKRKALETPDEPSKISKKRNRNLGQRLLLIYK